MEKQVAIKKRSLYRDRYLTIKTKGENLIFNFRQGSKWKYSTICPLVGASVINDTIYKDYEEILNIEIKNYIKDFDTKTFVYYITGGYSFWTYESYIEFEEVYEKLLKNRSIKSLITKTLKSNTIKDVIKTINEYKKDKIEKVKSKYSYDNYNFDEDI